MGLLGGGLGKLAGGLGKGGLGKLAGGLGKGGLGKGPLAKLGQGGLGQGKLGEALKGIGGKLGDAVQQMGGPQGIMDMIQQFAGQGQGAEAAGGQADAAGQAGAGGQAGGDNIIQRLVQALLQGGDPNAIDGIAAQLKEKAPDPQLGQIIDLVAGIGKQAMQGGGLS